MRIGDAAIAIDPLCGQGVYEALRVAPVAAAAVHTVQCGAEPMPVRKFLAERTGELWQYALLRWAVTADARLLHLSLGLAADRAVLRAAIAVAIAAGCIIVAATPARGVLSFPAGYPGVIQASGDARCAPTEISWLLPAASRFGGCPRALGAAAKVGGASLGAAHVTRFILREYLESGPSRQAITQRLRERAAYIGPERF